MLDAILKRLKDDGESPRRRFDDKLETTLDNLTKKTDDLHDWHNKEDENGVRIWYNQPWVMRTFDEMETEISTQTATLNRIEQYHISNLDVIKESSKNMLILASAIKEKINE